MSTKKGALTRVRPQKHQNRSAFKNTLHDTSQRTKQINSLQVTDVCVRCKEIIEWKIKYKKYKPLTQPKKCVNCGEKNVKKAYHVMCHDCGRKLEKCTKCCQLKELILAPEEKEPLKMTREMKFVFKTLPERRRRTFMRWMERKPREGLTEEQENIELMEKLNSLKVDDDDSDFDDFSDNVEEEDDKECTDEEN